MREGLIHSLLILFDHSFDPIEGHRPTGVLMEVEAGLPVGPPPNLGLVNGALEQLIQQAVTIILANDAIRFALGKCGGFSHFGASRSISQKFSVALRRVSECLSASV